MSDFEFVCHTQDVPPGEARMFVARGRPVAVFNVDGEYLALDNRCPHAGASLAHGFIEDDVVACRIHHWRFSMRTGEYLDEPKPACNATSLTVRVAGDRIEVDTAGLGPR